MILVIDNYDSFTFNLVHYLQMLGETVVIHRNNALQLTDIEQLAPSHIVLSPGPGRPENAGIMTECIRAFIGKIPLFGVCLGHQAIAQVFGAQIKNANAILHGKTSDIFHNNRGCFQALPQPFVATRYHSLVVDRNTLSHELEITAWTKKDNKPDEIMGIKHKTLPIEGVQFHPESILTDSGLLLLRNFIQPQHIN